jgi:5-hydroxyisourate hydrolase
MMAKVTTHVLDTANGRPGAGMKVEFSVYEGAAWKRLKSITTNKDGRTDEPLADGQYRLKFHVGEYFKTKEFLDVVPVRFNISDGGGHYHVPLLCSPWSYTTYRGS